MKERRLLFLLLILIASATSSATHLRTADIQVTRLCDRPFTYRILITAYINTLSRTPFGSENNQFQSGGVKFGDGTQVNIPPVFSPIRRTDLGPNIAVATYTVDHTYDGEGEYTVTYFERDRSAGVLNIPDAGDVPYVTSVTLNVTNKFGCNSLPQLQIAPVDRACLGNVFSHSPGAFDDEGDSLSYELIVPYGIDERPVPYYSYPDDPKFYGNYGTANEAGTGPPLFAINPKSGLITWDAPRIIGEYNIAFRVTEWRNDPVTDRPIKLSSTIRDMQIIVEECTNIRPVFILVPEDVCVEAGTSIHETIIGGDSQHDAVKLDVVSETLSMPAPKISATHLPEDLEFQPPGQVAQVTYNWNTDCSHVRKEPYQIIFKITDKPTSGTTLTAFHVWRILVIAPAPVWKEAKLDLVKRHAKLSWKKYTCADPANIEIWRKIGGSASPAPCVTGVKQFSGYERIAVVGPADTTFVDTNNNTKLIPGAQYCYRIVAVFNLPSAMRSYASEELCIDPIEVSAPVITHVSVEATARKGNVRIAWRSPMAINKTQFPEPYEYEIYRGKGFSGSSNLKNITPTRIRDTTFVDNEINTLDSAFNYRIVLYSKTENNSVYSEMDTSERASTVRLKALPASKRIELSWRDSVPWSNVVELRPRHLIYRGVSRDDLKLIDSVDVTENGFVFNDEDVDDATEYFYRIETIGTYGNPKIRIQKNLSQIASTYPDNTLTPCVPVVSIAVTDCNSFHDGTNCNQSKFSNAIAWTVTFKSDCRKDIRRYSVYASSLTTGVYELIASNIDVTQPFFTEYNLPSFARCYRVTTIDALGHESEMSDAVCNDNCPHYELPNVFTPNGDGCNDILTASTDELSRCGSISVIQCAQFVKEVRLRIYNRWGREVYTFTSGEGRTTDVNWDGRDSNGSLLEPAIYYYIADLTFDRVDPSTQNSTIKGWIQIMQ